MCQSEEQSKSQSEVSASESVAVPLATGQDSQVQLDSVVDDRDSSSKTVLEIDEDGNWSKSVPGFQPSMNRMRLEPEPTADSKTGRIDQDKVLFGLFAGAAVLLVVVIGLLLI